MLSCICSVSLLLSGAPASAAEGMTVKFPASRDPDIRAAQEVLVQAWAYAGGLYVDPSLNHQDWNKLLQDSLAETFKAKSKSEALAQVAVLVGALGDPFTRVLLQDEARGFSAQVEGKVFSTGLSLGVDPDGGVRVTNVAEGSPAQAAGIKVADQVVAVNGTATLRTDSRFLRPLLRQQLDLKIMRRSEAAQAAPAAEGSGGAAVRAAESGGAAPALVGPSLAEPARPVLVAMEARGRPTAAPPSAAVAPAAPTARALAPAATGIGPRVGLPGGVVLAAMPPLTGGATALHTGTHRPSGEVQHGGATPSPAIGSSSDAQDTGGLVAGVSLAADAELGSVDILPTVGLTSYTMPDRFLDVHVSPGPIPYSAVRHTLLAGTGGAGRPVGYIKIATFADGVAQRVESAVTQMRSAGARGWILDLRDNPGGVVGQGLEVAGLFLKPGEPFARIYGRTGNEQVPHVLAAAPATAAGDPVVVLLNRHSASTSELLAGALRDDGHALLLGERSYGKGRTQAVVPLGSGAMLLVSTDVYTTPGGTPVDHVGLRPGKACRDGQRDAGGGFGHNNNHHAPRGPPSRLDLLLSGHAAAAGDGGAELLHDSCVRAGFDHLQDARARPT